MKKNFKGFLVRLVILGAIIFLTRAIFQFPIEYFGMNIFKQTVANRLFSKIDALQILIVVGVFFGLYYRKRISALKHPNVNIKKSIIFILLGEIIIVIYYLFRASTNYFNISTGLLLIIIQIAILISLGAAFLCFTIAVFSIEYIKSFWKKLKKELIVAAIVAIILYNLLMLFQNQWLFFSTGVSNILNSIFSHLYPVSYHLGTNGPILTVSNFSVAIGPPCSGIDSMFLFTAFFAGLFALDHRRMNKSLFFISFIVGLIGVYAVNILRLFLLILAGINISPKFAVGLFHTNAGWLLFVIYFLGYYMIIRKFIYKDRLPEGTK